MTKSIILRDPETIKKFVEAVTKVEGEVNLYGQDRRYKVNAKSIMGIFSLNLMKPVTLETKTYSKELETYLKKIEA